MFPDVSGRLRGFVLTRGLFPPNQLNIDAPGRQGAGTYCHRQSDSAQRADQPKPEQIRLLQRDLTAEGGPGSPAVFAAGLRHTPAATRPDPLAGAADQRSGVLQRRAVRRPGSNIGVPRRVQHLAVALTRPGLTTHLDKAETGARRAVHRVVRIAGNIGLLVVDSHGHSEAFGQFMMRRTVGSAADSGPNISSKQKFFAKGSIAVPANASK